MRKRHFVTCLLPLLLLSACSEPEVVCGDGQTVCGKQCVSLLTDSHHCGACGVAAGPLEVCSGGAPVCRAGVATCGDVCTDLARDPANCGACGAGCAAGEYCTTAAGETSCTESCPEGFSACGGACVDLDGDPFHCGACGNACAAGEACRAGTCRADLYVACQSTSEIVSVSADLQPAGDPRTTPTGPSALALLGDTLFSANGWRPASVSVLPLDPSRPRMDVPVNSDDLQAIVPYANVLLVSTFSGTMLILDASGAVLDEIPLPDQQSGPNPHGIAVLGTTAYVALYGSGPDSGQKIAMVDLSPLAACTAPDPAPPACGAGGACPDGRSCVDGACRLRCGAATGAIDLMDVPGSYDPPGLPLPTGAVAALGRVYVSLSNLADDPDDGYVYHVKPAGPGKLAVIDPGPSVSILDLGSACSKPGAMVLRGTTLWVACGSLSFPDLAPGVLVPIELSGAAPAIGAPIDVSTVVPGRLAFCAGMGYLADQSSGAVVRFDPAAGTADAPVDVCPSGLYWTAVSDIACAP
jgi:hypothetical protein